MATAASIEGAIDDNGLAQVMVGAAFFALQARSSGQGGPVSALQTPFAGRVAGLAVFAWELLGAALAGDGSGLCERVATPEFALAAARYVQVARQEFPKLAREQTRALESRAQAELGLVVTELRQAATALLDGVPAGFFGERWGTPEGSLAGVRELAKQLAHSLAERHYSALQSLFDFDREPSAALLLFGTFWFQLEREVNADERLPRLLEVSLPSQSPEYLAALGELCELNRAVPRYSGVAPSLRNPARPPDENVQFSVYRPRVIEPARWVTLLAFAHLSEKREGAAPDDPEPLEQVESEARAELKDQFDFCQQLVEDTRHPIPTDSTITFVPLVQGIEFNPPKLSIQWSESVHKASFRMRAARSIDGTTARGDLSVYCGALLVADLQLSITVDSRRARAKDSQPTLARDGQPVSRYRRIFASYAHADAEVVARIQGYAKALGDEYLMDTLNLRAGEHWNEALEALIERADVFQLFWSSHSMGSEFVRREWQHALSLGRKNFVRPSYWEVPMPSCQARALPPVELAKLHFQHIGLGPAAVVGPSPLDATPNSEAALNPEPGPAAAPDSEAARSAEVPATSRARARGRALAALTATLGIVLISSALLRFGASNPYSRSSAAQPPVIAAEQTTLAPPVPPSPDPPLVSTAGPPTPVGVPVHAPPIGTHATPPAAHAPTMSIPSPRKAATPEAASGSSGSDAQRIRQVVALHQPQVRRECWEPARRAHPAAPPSARVTLTIVVSASGSVETVSSSGAPDGYPELSACIQHQVESWQFARADEPTTATVPFVFRDAPRASDLNSL